MTLYRLELLDVAQQPLETLDNVSIGSVDDVLIVRVPVHWDETALYTTLEGMRRTFPQRSVMLINDAVSFVRLVEVES